MPRPGKLLSLLTLFAFAFPLVTGSSLSTTAGTATIAHPQNLFVSLLAQALTLVNHLLGRYASGDGGKW